MTSKIQHSLREAGACVHLPFSGLGQMGPTSFHLSHRALTSLCDTSCMCNVLVLQNCKTPGLSLAHRAHQFYPTQVFDLMDTKHMASGPEVSGESRKEENRENNLMSLLFSAALSCSAWSAVFRRKTLTVLPTAKV